jgi:hypothetical protein
VSGTIDFFRGEAEINWIRAHQPEIWDRDRQVPAAVGLPELPPVRRFVDSTGSQVAICRSTTSATGGPAKRDWKWQALAVSREMLPELVAPGTQLIGAIERAGRRATGIPEGTPLLAAAADKACEVIGAGCVEPHIGCLSYGTTATINTTSQRYVEVTPFIPPYPAGDSRRLQHRGAGLSRLLDGQLVQGAVRPPRAAARALAGTWRPSSCSTSWPTRCRRARWA